jgi:hypothetical protein
MWKVNLVMNVISNSVPVRKLEEIMGRIRKVAFPKRPASRVALESNIHDPFWLLEAPCRKELLTYAAMLRGRLSKMLVVRRKTLLAKLGRR